MRYLRQFLIIMLMCFLGELLKYFIPLPIPAGIYGMVLMFIALQTGILKITHIRETAQFLIDIMPALFIPAGVGLISSWEALRSIWLQIMVICIVSTVAVMIVSGRVTQSVMKREGRKHE